MKLWRREEGAGFGVVKPGEAAQLGHGDRLGLRIFQII